jgi:hypothetical protein
VIVTANIVATALSRMLSTTFVDESLQRPLELVLNDVINGYVSLEAATKLLRDKYIAKSKG